MNAVTNREIDEFVKSVAGKQLSIRDIDMLATGYFKGSDHLRQQIKSGNLAWSLGRLKEGSKAVCGCSRKEQAILKALEMILRYMQRFCAQSNGSGAMSNAFAAQANVLSSGVIRHLNIFSTQLRAFYDRSRQA
jgi:hypothetical protein